MALKPTIPGVPEEDPWRPWHLALCRPPSARAWPSGTHSITTWHDITQHSINQYNISKISIAQRSIFQDIIIQRSIT